MTSLFVTQDNKLEVKYLHRDQNQVSTDGAGSGSNGLVQVNLILCLEDYC